MQIIPISGQMLLGSKHDTACPDSGSLLDSMLFSTLPPPHSSHLEACAGEAESPVCLMPALKLEAKRGGGCPRHQGWGSGYRCPGYKVRVAQVL